MHSPALVKHPMLLVSGFLGSGKTTYLRSLMGELSALGVGVSVIINDFENADVDATLLRQQSDGVNQVISSLSGNCLCCDSLDDFMEAVGTIPVAEDGVLLVEVNGTTDTLEMISALTVRPEAKSRFWSPLQVTLVDAQRWGHRGAHGSLEREQLTTATHYWVSKGDTVPPSIYNEVRLRAALGAPRALEASAEALAGELAKIVQEDSAPSRVAYSTRPRVRGLRRDLAPLPLISSHHHTAERAFTSLAFHLCFPVAQKALDEFLQQLPEAVVRVKGLVRLIDDPSTPYSFQHVRPMAETRFIRLDGFDTILDAYEIKQVPMVMVIIGVRLPQRLIQEAFETFRCQFDQKSEVPSHG